MTDRAAPIVYPNTQIGARAAIGEFVVLGLAPRNHAEGDLPLIIGDGSIIRSHTVIYAGNSIGRGLETGHGVLIRESNEIGDEVSIGSHSIVEHHVVIKSRVRIHSNAFIPEFSVLDEEAWIGPNVVFTNAIYPLGAGAKAGLRGPHICSGAKIGANATLLPGITIGRDSLVGAGAVVLSDVPDRKVVVGNPARIVHDVDELEAYRAQGR
jgi:acetyltransferase-like isoleucine patch superfamily enzyme